ncbi:MAG TPA: hypothetical protein DD670_12215 [Planctomycetaceae bacterium]|nr:hypothetical protein [Planctomycetaceae bacterium]
MRDRSRGFGLSGSFRGSLVRHGGFRPKASAIRARQSRSLKFEPLEGRHLLSIGGVAPNTIWFTDLTVEEQTEFHAGNALLEWSDATDDRVDGRLVLSGITLEAITAEGLDFTKLQVPGWGVTGEPGVAELPVFRTWLTIPDGVDVTASGRAEMMTSLGQDYLVYPAQEPVANSDDDSGVSFSFDAAYYRGEVPQATSLITVSEPMIARGTSMVLVEIAPFRYDPVSGEIIVTTDMTLSLDFQPQETDDASAASDEFGDAAAASAADADYLIIVADTFVNQIQPLAEWKQMKGYKTYVAPMSEVGTTYNDVLSYISNAYHTGTQTSYVLIVGDQETVPGYQLIGHPYYSDDHVWYADYPYACVDGTDLLADLAIGRLSGDTTTQITTMVNKVLTYEKSPDMGDWYDDALFVGYFQDTEDSTTTPDGIEQRSFMETTHRLTDFLGGDYDFWGNPDPYNMGYTVHTSLTAQDLSFPTYYYSNRTFPSRITPPSPVPSVWTNLWTSKTQATTNITTAVNNGVSFVMQRDHGSSSGWGTPSFSTTRVNALTNGNRLPVVFSISCETGRFDTTDCFAEAFLRKSGGGAVGIVAAARVSYSRYNDCLATAIVDGFWDTCDATWTNSVYPTSWRPSEVLNRAKVRLLEGYGASDSTAKLTARMFNWFGDPEMMMRTETPSILTVTHSNNAVRHVGADFTVNVTSQGVPVEGALVCISHATADDYWVATTDADGLATFVGLNPTESGDYNLVVTEQNAVAHVGSFVVPDSHFVNSLEDVVAVDGVITLREALEAANSNTAVGDAPAGSALTTDVIMFDPSVFGGTIVLGGAQLEILDDVEIRGPGAESLTIDAGGLSRAFFIGSGVEATVEGLTLVGGHAEDGGAIASQGTFTARDLVVSGNSASNQGGGFFGVGISTFENTVFAGNQAVAGGAVANSGVLHVANSILVGNRADEGGGAVANSGAGAITLVNSTVVCNAAAEGGGIHSPFGSATVQNSIVALNEAATDPDLLGALAAGSGYNLIGVDPIFVRNPASGGDGWGDDPANDDYGDLRLAATSPAIDAGSNALALDAAGNPLVVDFGGDPRIGRQTVDIGAYETNRTVYVVNSLNDVVAADGVLTLREALQAANTNTAVHEAPAGFVEGWDVVRFDLSLHGGTILLGGSQLAILDRIVIEGPGADLLSIDAGGLSRVFSVGSGIEVEMAGLTIRGGSAQDVSSTDLNDDDGGGIFNTGVLTITDVVLRDNSAQGDGGGVYNKQGAVTVVTSALEANSAGLYGGAIHNEPAGTTTATGSIFTNNSAVSRGGAIYNLGTLTIDDSTFNGNTAMLSTSYGGGVANLNGGTARIVGTIFTGNRAAYGGGVFTSQNTTITIANSVVSGNHAHYFGGGLLNYSNSVMTVVNTTVASNNAGQNGGGVYSPTTSQLIVKNSIIALNTAASTPNVFGTLHVASSHNLVDGDPHFLRNPNNGGDVWGDNPATPGVDESANDDYGDLRLYLDSPAINAGSNALAVAPGGVPLTIDVYGNPRIVYNVVDLGANELQEVTLPGDANGDNVVNELDAAILGENWGRSGMTRQQGDFDGDGLVGPKDAAILAAHLGMTFTLPTPEAAAPAEPDAAPSGPFVGPLADLEILAGSRSIAPAVRVESRLKRASEAGPFSAPGAALGEAIASAEAVDAVVGEESDWATEETSLFRHRLAWSSMVARRMGPSRSDADNAAVLAADLLLARDC